MEILTWIKANWQSILEIIGAVVTLATLIVKITPSTKDDGVVNAVVKFLSIFSLVNPDGSFIGEKKKD